MEDEEDEEEIEDDQRRDSEEGAVGGATAEIPKMGNTQDMRRIGVSVTKPDTKTGQEDRYQQEGARPKVPSIIQFTPEQPVEPQNLPNPFTVVSRATVMRLMPPTVCMSSARKAVKTRGSEDGSLPMTNECRGETAAKIQQETGRQNIFQEEIAIDRSSLTAVPFALQRPLSYTEPVDDGYQSLLDPCLFEGFTNMVDIRLGLKLEDLHLPWPDLPFGRTRRLVGRQRNRQHENSDVCVFGHERCQAPSSAEGNRRETEPHHDDREPPHRTEGEDMSPDSE